MKKQFIFKKMVGLLLSLSIATVALNSCGTSNLGLNNSYVKATSISIKPSGNVSIVVGQTKTFDAIKQPDDKLQISCDSTAEEKLQSDHFNIVAGKKSINIIIVQEEKGLSYPSPVGTDSITIITDNLHTPVILLNQKNSLSLTSTLFDSYNKNVFGVDLGIGTRKVNEWGTYLDLGIRWTHNFTPYIGWDIINLNFQGYLKGNFFNDGLFQAMTGVRAYTKDFAQNMKGYASLKAGYGSQSYLNASGFASELEIGLLLINNISVSLVYNYQNLQGQLNKSKFNVNCDYAGLRLGYNF